MFRGARTLVRSNALAHMFSGARTLVRSNTTTAQTSVRSNALTPTPSEFPCVLRDLTLLRTKVRAPLVAAVLFLLVFAMFPGVVLGTQTFVFRDFGLFSYPVACFQRQCFWRGELPLWNPYNLCGVPFLAQWNTMCLYPPALFYLLLPLTWALPMFCLLHLVWGGLGMFHLARQWTRNSLAGALAAIIFAFNGLTLNLLMWPSHIATFSWLPWVLWLVPNGWRAGGRKLGWGVAAATLQMLAGGPETILVTWGLLALLLVGDVLQCLLRSRDVPQTASARGNMSSGARTLVRSN
ncbi:MAG: hypothetical protein ACREIC_13875, partial [Limisphaerales bacterium]